MLDIKIIRENPEMIQDIIQKRNMTLDVKSFLELDQKKRDLIIKTDELRTLKNKVSKEIPNLSNEEKPTKISEMKSVWEELKTLEESQKIINEQWNQEYYKFPNLLDPTASIWNTDEDNIIEYYSGEKPTFGFPVKPHYEIWEKKWWIDIEKGTEVSGARFWYLKWDLVLLQLALQSYALSKLTAKGFEPMLPPVLVREQAMFWTWFFPADEDGVYSVNPWEDNLYLVWTSEVPVTSYHMWETLDLSQAKMYAWMSSCFRREAGSAGKDTRGILRGHQFDKVEMVVFCKQDESQKMHDFMVAIEEDIWNGLGIPFQKMNVCSWDLGNPAMKKYDLEAWMPAQEKYREVTSCSNVWEFQTRRLWIKYKDDNWKSQYAHTLNGTVIAMSRCMIAIIENFQTAEGNVKIPDVLVPFMAWKTEI
mgnify:CR=1 FL=1